MDNTRSDKIEQALKRIGEGLIQVILRGGKIVKIPKQEISRPPKDNIREVVHIDDDITE